MDSTELIRAVGSMDIYLLDQLLRGRISERSRIFDAGCGGGRNLKWFLEAGHPVAGVDGDPSAIEKVREVAARFAMGSFPAREGSEAEASATFRVETIESNTFEERSADVVISSAVLHFARDHDHFRAMLDGSWRVLASGGLFFCRLASRIGMPLERFRPLGGGRYTMPDGSDRYLVDEAQLLSLGHELEGELLDPIKTTVVQDQRCMTTWVLRRR
ncbi:MAG: class I SAM-dependent methyltransferase [Acidobacteria bacterium]|nr:class I SAM-dependent methyltransferase [Acidobacteriota bacterium]